MQTTYRLNTQELTVNFIEALKRLLPDQDIEIVVSTLPKKQAINDQAWLKGMADNPSFNFLHDEAEAIYSVTDGIPLEDEK